MTPVRRAERYTIGQTTEGTVITMCQNREALGFAFVACALFAVSWWVGPGGPMPLPQMEGRFYWVWLIFMTVMIFAGLLGAQFRERWVITDTHIIATDTFGMRGRRVAREERLRLHLDASGAAVGGAVFPYEVEVEDSVGKPILRGFEFSTRRGAEDFIEALRILLPVETTHSKPDGSFRRARRDD